MPKAKIISEIEKMGNRSRNYQLQTSVMRFSLVKDIGENQFLSIIKKECLILLPVSALPLELPEVEKYLPTEDGDPPLEMRKISLGMKVIKSGSRFN